MKWGKRNGLRRVRFYQQSLTGQQSLAGHLKEKGKIQESCIKCA